MSEFIAPGFKELARRSRDLEVPSRPLEGIIFRVMREQQGDVWSDLFGDEGEDVWHRRDPNDRAAWDPPLRYTESFDVAMSLKFSSIRLDALRELVRTDATLADPKWRPWSCTLSLDTFSRTFTGAGFMPATAFLDAIFQVHAFISDEGIAA